MANIVVIENDARFKREIEKFVRELGQHTVRFFNSGAEFYDQYFKKPKKGPEEEKPIDPAAPVSDTTGEINLLSFIDLVIFRNTCIDVKPGDWASATWHHLDRGKYFPEGRAPRFILTMFEDEKIKKNNLLHPLIDDLIFLPFDRLLFLQKLEIILTLPKKTKPSFLFMQDGKFPIEISKRTKITRVSDTGFTLVNPFQLRPGTGAHFYMKFPGSEETVNFYAKAHSSERAPDSDTKYHVNFSFFGMNKETYFKVKKYLSQRREYRPLIEDDERRFRFHEENLFLSAEEKQKKQVLVLDTEPNNAKNLRDTIQSNIDNCVVSVETSYHLFLRKYFQKNTSGQLPHATPDEFYADSVHFLINKDTQKLVMLLTQPPKADAKILGYETKEYFDKPDDWKKLFNSDDSEKIVIEVLKTIRENQTVERPLIFKTASGEYKRAHGRFVRALTPEVRVELGPSPEAKGIKADPQSPILTSFDCIVVDGRYLTEGADNWIAGLEDLMRANRMNVPKDGLKIIVLGEDGEQRVATLKDSRVFQLLFKPHSTHALLQAIAIATKSPHTKYNFQNQGWFEVNLDIYVAQEAILNSISEFGASITHPRAISDGTFLYLHGSIFEAAPDSILCARFYFCDKSTDDKEKFECSFLYWGINDQFLRFARTWIRENYAQSKGG